MSGENVGGGEGELKLWRCGGGEGKALSPPRYSALVPLTILEGAKEGLEEGSNCSE